MKSEIIIFSDGASKGNPGPGGWGAIVSLGDTIVELGGKETHTTNNRMELMGAIKALEIVVENMNGEPELSKLPITLYTDSNYVINGITKWIAGWKKRQWKTLQKEDVINKDLWERLDNAVENIKFFDTKISWKYVGGHIGIVGNERVDEIASNFAEGQTQKLFLGNRADYNFDISNISFNTEQKKEKSTSKSRSRSKAYSYLSMVNGKIETHKTWEECERRVNGISGAKFKKALNESEEKIIIAQWKM